MYRHLLVPIDDSGLSTDVVSDAVGLALAVGARITFFHAAPDHASSWRGDADVVRLTSRDEYVYAFSGKARELLAKAEAAAHAHGVPCDAVQVVHQRPAAAIVEVARAHQCDLIFMASHGRGGRLGMALTSETLSVLRTAGLPVLVSATRDPQTPARAIGIIRDEHRSLAAVMHAWMHALASSRTEGAPVDPALTHAIIRYIRTFPVALHHPKEEEHLFRRLRQRTDTVNADLDELERQHERDRELVAELARLAETLTSAADERAAADAARALEDAVHAYASFLWAHLGREESVILPAAQRHLTETDWSAIDAAFEANRDPGFAGETEKQYRQLFSRIVNAAKDWP